MSLREELIQVAAVAVAIVQDIDTGTTAMDIPAPSPIEGLRIYVTELVLEEVAAERQRQERKWGPRHHDNEVWMNILAEEVGEAAREVEHISRRGGETLSVLVIAEEKARVFLKGMFRGDDDEEYRNQQQVVHG